MSYVNIKRGAKMKFEIYVWFFFIDSKNMANFLAVGNFIKHGPFISKECINIELTDEFHG